MNVYVVGNPLVRQDSLPLRMLPALVKTFPQVSFEAVDPNENFVPADGSIIIDTVSGIETPTWFDNIESFVQTRSVSAHDYDLGFHLRLLLKLKKIDTFILLGVPQGSSQAEVIGALEQKLRSRPTQY